AQVLRRAELVVQIGSMAYHADLSPGLASGLTRDQCLAPRGSHQTSKDANERRFAGAVWPEQEQSLAGLDGQVEIDQRGSSRRLAGIPGGQAFRAKRGHASPVAGEASWRASVSSRKRCLPCSRSTAYSAALTSPAAKRSSSAA